jgi:hypothetical protein
LQICEIYWNCFGTDLQRRSQLREHGGCRFDDTKGGLLDVIKCPSLDKLFLSLHLDVVFNPPQRQLDEFRQHLESFTHLFDTEQLMQCIQIYKFLKYCDKYMISGHSSYIHKTILNAIVYLLRDQQCHHCHTVELILQNNGLLYNVIRDKTDEVIHAFFPNKQQDLIKHTILYNLEYIIDAH